MKLMAYNDTPLVSANDIKIGTYNKCPKCIPIMFPIGPIYVQNINKIADIDGGTVYAKCSVGADYEELPKEEVKTLINYGGFCYVAGTPS